MSRRTVSPLPADDHSNGWQALLPPRLGKPPLMGDQSADWVVIGAGFTGLSAARRLGELRPNDRILLLEAERVSDGASGRNSGFIIDLPHNVDAQSVEDQESNNRVRRLNRAAIANLKDLIDRHAIDCDWSELGKIHAAIEPAGEREIASLARGLEAMGEAYDLLSRDQLADILGTPYYSQGLRTASCVVMQPAALVRGLADSLPDAVQLCENSPVSSFEKAAQGWRLTTPQGSVTTPKLLLATDAFTRCFGFLESRLVPVYTYASLTPPLSIKGAPEWAVLPAHKAGTTLRRLKDGRVLVRNSFRYGGDFTCSDAHLARARHWHLKSLKDRWPEAPAVFENSWGGVVCFSRNFTPFFGQLAEGLYAAAGTNGVGAAKGTIAGRLLAESILGHESPLLSDITAYPPPVRNPPEPLLGWAVSARLMLEQFAAGRER